MKRDPRVDPRPGDIVRHEGVTRHVEARSEEDVKYKLEGGRFTYDLPLSKWQDFHADYRNGKGAEVIHAQD